MVTVTGELVIPEKEAVIVTVPIATPCNCPPDGWSNSAMVGSELCQVANELISAVEPSEYVPVAINVMVEAPSSKLWGWFGVIAIDTREAVTLPVVVVFEEEEDDVVLTVVLPDAIVLEEAACDVVVVTAVDDDEQADIVKTSTNPIARQEPISCILSTFIVACPLLD
ncbi:MAG: hypothetical protein WCF70_10450 [Dehalococcoidales bacterium]